MKIGLSFLGAAQNITGSRFLLEANGFKILVDCGLYQERQLRERNWDHFPTPAGEIDAVLLTHAHLDHCGWLPRLVKEGFRGRIFCTTATGAIARIVLLDAAKLQVEDAEFKRKRHRREGRQGPFPVVPLYTTEDVEATLPLFAPVKYNAPVEVAEGIKASFHDAGHILGASIIKVNLTGNGEKRTILFSGDIGRWDKPILRDPTVFDRADYVLIESTYGDRVHDNSQSITDTLTEVVNSTMKAGGNIVVPSFSVERSQELLYHLHELLRAGRFPPLMAFLDSPMAILVTEVFEKHPEMFDEEMTKLIRNHKSPFEFPGLNMSRTTHQSKAINNIRGTVMIIAGSGMCTGGRIKHHLVNNISRPESTILFVGYQAADTLGRHILDGAEEVRILGQKYPVKARIVRAHGCSGHADRDELYRWLGGLKEAPRKLFVVHGENNVAHKFADFVKEKNGWDVSVPAYRDEVILN